MCHLHNSVNMCIESESYMNENISSQPTSDRSSDSNSQGRLLLLHIGYDMFTEYYYTGQNCQPHNRMVPYNAYTFFFLFI